MIPPSRCWTVLLLPSGLMEPEATAPPSIGAKYDQEPNAAMKRRMSRNPSWAGPPIACRRLRAPSLWSYSQRIAQLHDRVGIGAAGHSTLAGVGRLLMHGHGAPASRRDFSPTSLMMDDGF